MEVQHPASTRENIIKANKELFNQGAYLEKSRKTKALKKPAKENTYPKFYGRHEHRVIAEKMIGRKLEKGEVVHHIDGDKHNNSPNNLMVMSQEEHIKLHQNQGDLKKEGDFKC